MTDSGVFPADRLVRPRNVKGTTVDEGVRDSWEPSIHLDGTPVDRFAISSSKPTRSHRFTKAGKGSRSPLLEDVGKTEVNRSHDMQNEFYQYLTLICV